MTAHLLSVNVGRPRRFEYKGRSAESAIWKRPVEGHLIVRGVNLQGDAQADRSVHGGNGVADRGGQENLTTRGLDLTSALVGERWEVGSAVLEVSEARMPCWKLGVRMNDAHFPKLFLAAGRPGAYLRILQEGDLGTGDEIRVVHRPDHDLTMADLSRIYAGDRNEAERLLDVPELSVSWREWAREWMDRHPE